MKVALAAFHGVSLLSLAASALPNVKRNESQPEISWIACPPGVAAAAPNGTECGTLNAPIDHDIPTAGTIALWVMRLKASGPKPLGSLFVNLGGPGSPASEWFASMVAIPRWSNALGSSYNIIGLDPRGTGKSNPILCDAATYNKQPQMLASGNDDSAFSRLVAYNKAVSDSCVKLTGKLVGMMDTVSTIKDFELARQALGDVKFNYLGFSYGTFLGQTYAELFPDKVGRMVLDGNMDHSLDWITGVMTESATYAATLEKFFSWCDANSTCALHGQDVRAIFAKITAPGATTPANCNNGTTCATPATGEDILANAQGMLSYVNHPVPGLVPGWADLSAMIDKANKGDASDLANKLAPPPPPPPPPPPSNSSSDGAPAAAFTAAYAQRAIMCLDFGSPVNTSADLRRVRDVAGALLPLTRGVSQSLNYGVMCAGWPLPVRDGPRRLESDRLRAAPPVLMVNALFDPETSAVWAAGAREQWPSAVSLWRNGSGHTSYITFGETSKAMDAFLIEGTMPVDGTLLQS